MRRGRTDSVADIDITDDGVPGAKSALETRMMAHFQEYQADWKARAVVKPRGMLPTKFTGRLLTDERRWICKSRLRGAACGYWCNEEDPLDTTDEESCRTCYSPMITLDEFSELLWGRFQSGCRAGELRVPIETLRKYMSGRRAMDPMLFRSAVAAMLIAEVHPPYWFLPLWEKIDQLDACGNLFRRNLSSLSLIRQIDLLNAKSILALRQCPKEFRNGAQGSGASSLIHLMWTFVTKVFNAKDLERELGSVRAGYAGKGNRIHALQAVTVSGERPAVHRGGDCRVDADPANEH